MASPDKKQTVKASAQQHDDDLVVPMQRTHPGVIALGVAAVLAIGGGVAYKVFAGTPEQPEAKPVPAAVGSGLTKDELERRREHLELSQRAFAAAEEKRKEQEAAAAAASAAAAAEEAKNAPPSPGGPAAGQPGAAPPPRKAPSSNDLDALDKLGAKTNEALGGN